MKINYLPAFPSVEDLRKKAKSKIPRFAFEYLDGGCNDDVNLFKNVAELRQVELKPYYLSDYNGPSLNTELFGHQYSAPFGIAPIGLQGLIWPNASEILAKAAHDYNIPFILSTVSTASIERVSTLTEGKAWFQLYHPAETALRDDLLKRSWESGIKVLVILCDVPSFGFRPRDIRNGLAMPPRMTLRNMLQIMSRPEWALRTLYHGQPSFATLKKYMPEGLDMKQLGQFMNAKFSGRLNAERVQQIREKWKGKVVLKGVATAEDAALAVKFGLDGIIVSNHGGRQLDAGQSAISSLARIAKKYEDNITVMMDSGIRSGPDVARAMACGAKFTFLGRSFMYGVAALGNRGGNHTISLLKAELQQVMEQLCCETTSQIPLHLITEK